MFQFHKSTALIVISFAAVSLIGPIKVANSQGGIANPAGFWNAKADGPQEIPAPAIAEKPSPCHSDSPVPASAITKGSFTVWTEPKDPKPGEKYTIMMQITVSEKLEKYPICDFSGSVTGTDGYKNHFGGPTEKGFVQVKNQKVRLRALVVPGAAELVKDVIQIKSKLLNEEQQIELKF